MLLVPLALTACGESATTAGPTVTETNETTVVSTTSVAAPTTVSASASGNSTVKFADDMETQGAFSTEEVRVPPQGGELVIQDVRAGSHDGYDRVVFEFSGPGKPGFIAGYNPEPRQQASGYEVEVPGQAYLELIIQGTPMGQMSEREDLVGVGPVRVAPGGGLVGAGNVAGVVHGGVFEADTQYFIGLDSARPFNVYALENPTRVVVDFKR